MILLELIDRAISIATRGLDPSIAAGLDSTAVAEDLLVNIFANVSGSCAADPKRRRWLSRPVTITFTDGEGTLPETVLGDYLMESVLYDPDDTSARYAHYLDFSVFKDDQETRLGRYIVDESVILVVQPGGLYEAGVGLTGDLTLLSPAGVAVPTSAGAAIVARDEVVELLLAALATELRDPALKSR